jgi:hypothetical protein
MSTTVAENEDWQAETQNNEDVSHAKRTRKLGETI